MGFFSSLWGKNSENGKNTQNNTPTVQQPRMTEAQRHDAFVQSLRTKGIERRIRPGGAGKPGPQAVRQRRWRQGARG